MLISLIPLYAGPFFKPVGPYPPYSIDSIEELEAVFRRLTNAGSPPAISFAVVKDNRVVYSKGFGMADAPRKIAATPDAVYHWFSITKIATAIAIFQLRERGLLRLDDRVDKYLPFFKVTYPAGSNGVTIQNLLNHSSGLPDAKLDLAKWIHYEGEPSVDQTSLVERILPKYSKLQFEPGSCSAYTNIGYMVLGAIIEKVSGQSYEDYIRQNILIPLEMNRTDFRRTNAMEQCEAAGSNPVFNLNALMIPFVRGKIVRGRSENHFWFNRFYNDQAPPSGLIGPVTDASRLMMAYLNRGELNGKRILSEESVYAMTHDGHTRPKKQDPSSSLRQGFGWQTWSQSGRQLIQHDGGGLGFYTIMRLFPDENLGMVIFTNDVSNRKEIKKIIKSASYLGW